MDLSFFIWFVIAIVQIVLFSIFLGKMFAMNKQDSVTETIDILPVCNYNGQMYWIEGKDLYREDSSRPTMDKKKAERVDQLDAKDLSPSEIIYIINMLEDAK